MKAKASVRPREYKSEWIKLGEALISGKKISEIALNGKTYKFDYTDEEFRKTAEEKGWSEEHILLALERRSKYSKTPQSDFICDMKSDYCLNSGGFGCIHGDTLICTDKGEVSIRELYEKGISPKVLSKDGKWSQAASPVKYEKAQLYKVRFGNNEVACTAKHRFLTPTGWKRLSELSVGERLQGALPFPRESISDNALSALLSGGFRLIERVLGSQSDCPAYPCSYGERPLSAISTFQGIVPLPSDALGHIQYKYSMGGHYSLSGYIHACRLSSRQSKSDSESLLQSRPASVGEGCTSVTVSARASASVQWLGRFLSKIITYPYRVLTGQCSIVPSFHSITSISPYAIEEYYDLHVFGTNNYLAEGVFHHNSGKSIALYIKMILFCKCFPNNRVLMGRKTLSDIDRAVLPELFDLMPGSWYEHRVKDGLINFTNGSQIILFGLDAMQSGNVADIKKAQQKLKSLNLGAYFIDQLEEVEQSVIEVLDSRLRRSDVPVRQGNGDCNPANFWAYQYFKKKEVFVDEQWMPNANAEKVALYESSMLNNPNLPGDYIRKQLSMGEDYVKRFVFGEWTTDLLLKGSVFAKEHIRRLEQSVKPPVSVEEACEIYEQPRAGIEYRMGVDPSEGVVDPSSISVVSSEGRKVAKFNGLVPITALSDKVKFLYHKYNKPLIIPESNAAGSALIREIRDLRVYRRKTSETKYDKETEKLGFRTSWNTKQQLINHFQELLRTNQIKIYDQKTIEEMKTFLWNNDATQQGAGAARGFHDDDVMSTLLAYWEFSIKASELALFAKSHVTQKKKFQWA